MTQKFIVGIDEVGRGPVAGPVSIGIVAFKGGSPVLGARDSKLMTPKAREVVYEEALRARDKGDLLFTVISQDALEIDRKGIAHCLSELVETGLSFLVPDPQRARVFLDGSLRAPSFYEQETIVKGDQTVEAISLASVIAKVERDRYMVTTAHPAFPQYGFDAHKGYGTKAHLAAILNHGLSPLHRRTFLSRVVQ